VQQLSPVLAVRATVARTSLCCDLRRTARRAAAGPPVGRSPSARTTGQMRSSTGWRSNRKLVSTYFLTSSN